MYINTELIIKSYEQAVATQVNEQTQDEESKSMEEAA